MVIDRNRLLEWHKWFAWYPVEVDHCRYVWLDFVWRKGETIQGLWFWSYRYE